MVHAWSLTFLITSIICTFLNPNCPKLCLVVYCFDAPPSLVPFKQFNLLQNLKKEHLPTLDFIFLQKVAFQALFYTVSYSVAEENPFHVLDAFQDLA